MPSRYKDTSNSSATTFNALEQPVFSTFIGCLAEFMNFHNFQSYNFEMFFKTPTVSLLKVLGTLRFLTRFQKTSTCSYDGSCGLKKTREQTVTNEKHDLLFKDIEKSLGVFDK